MALDGYAGLLSGLAMWSLKELAHKLNIYGWLAP